MLHDKAVFFDTPREMIDLRRCVRTKYEVRFGGRVIGAEGQMRRTNRRDRWVLCGFFDPSPHQRLFGRRQRWLCGEPSKQRAVTSITTARNALRIFGKYRTVMTVSLVFL